MASWDIKPCSDWLLSDYFGLGFTTLNLKPLRLHCSEVSFDVELTETIQLLKTLCGNVSGTLSAGLLTVKDTSFPTCEN